MAENTATVPEIKKAAAIIRHLSADEKVQEEAFQREQALHLEASLIGGAERRGIAQGIEIGGKLGIQAGKIIMRMMNEGKVEAEIISELKSRLNITEESAYDFLNEYRD